MMRFISGRRVVLAVGGLIAVGLLTGCGTFRAERQGKQLGDAICDMESASANDLQNAADKVQREMNDLQRIVGRPVNEDVKDITNNLSDLRTHVQQGNHALARQDIAVIERNFQAVDHTLSGKGQAAYDGVQEGLGGCDYSG
jgi:hypothetical protein